MTQKQIRRPKHRPITAFLGAVAIAAPLLAGCGFDMATDRPYTQAAGDNDVSGDQKVLNALIVASAEGSGTFVATLSNNDRDAAVSLEGLEPSTAGTFESPEVTPQEIGPGAALNLATDGGIKLTGDFDLGNFVGVTVTFDNGESVTVDAPVVANEGQWEGLDVPEPTFQSDPSESSSPSPSPSEAAEPTESPSPTE